jgi:hypothetical protein
MTSATKPSDSPAPPPPPPPTPGLGLPETRGGTGRGTKREIATISPARAASGKRIKQLLREHRGDRAWSRELRELRASLVRPIV